VPKAQLFQTEAKTRRQGTSKALIVLERALCPSCREPLHVSESTQLPLLRHGGYGAALRVVTRVCHRCHRAYEVERSAVNPRLS
jgi:uncharacterized protein YbaR (Trm112 family)